MIRTCGIIGFGVIGRLFHSILKAPGNDAGLIVAAIADPELPDGLDGLSRYAGYRELLASPIDAVLIATPPSIHYRVAMDALHAGKDVLVEKPPTDTVSQSRELIAFNNAAGKVLYFAFHARYNRAVRLAREKLAGKRIKKFSVLYREDVSRYHRPGSWVFKEGVLKDSGINAVSVLTYILPNPSTLQVVESKLFIPDPRLGETRATVVLSWEDRAIGQIDLDWHYTGQEVRNVTVETDDREYRIDIANDLFYENGRQLLDPPTIRETLRREYERMLTDFAACLAGGISSCSTVELGLIEEARREIHLGQFS